MACLYDDEQIISLLLRKGADVSAETDDRSTPFSMLRLFANNNQCVITMIKMFSKLNFENVPFSDNDLKLIQANPMFWEHFEKCTTEVEQMESTKFYGHYSYYSVLNMSKNIKKLAVLNKNEKFLAKFGSSLKKFPYYQKILEANLEEATKVRDDLESVESKLKSILGNLFPSLVVKILANNLKVKDLP